MSEARPSYTISQRVFSQSNFRTIGLPLCITLAPLVFYPAIPLWISYPWLGLLAPLLFLICFGYLFLLLLLRIIQRKWVSSIAVIVAAFLLVCTYALLGPIDDSFSHGLSIPSGIDISIPKQWPPDGVKDKDTYQDAVLDSLAKHGDGKASLTLKCDSLLHVRRDAPEILDRYLATHPGWRVFRQHGRRFATRRWTEESAWRYSLHGYYTHYDLPRRFQQDGAEFQTRFTIGLDGLPWARGTRKRTNAKLGDTIEPVLDTRHSRPISHMVIEAEDVVIEVFEESATKERRITKAALALLDQELKVLEGVPNWQAVNQALEPSYTCRGVPKLELYKSFQPGIYDSCVWVNPGEPGMVYLKAFEITNNYRLSAKELMEYGNEWVGWSSDPEELFFSNTHFTVFEGDWDKLYAARFELWFVPDSGQPERKLLEENFKINGWMR